jgi:hypothetical protein
VVFLGKVFQPIKARSLLKSEKLERYFTWVGSWPYPQTLDLAEKLAVDKHSSELITLINRKRPRADVLKLFLCNSCELNKLDCLYLAGLSNLI